jgi:hypothetical protein
MTRLLTAFALAVAMAAGMVVLNPATVAAQNPTEACRTCRVAFTLCMHEARGPAEAAACRAAALECLQECASR